MLSAIELLKSKYLKNQICIVQKTVYDPKTQCSSPEYCIMVPELCEIAVSSSSLEDAAHKLLGDFTI